jgi:endonuclease/exonuclease/phosphatase family metal-dependent hydrolase
LIKILYKMKTMKLLKSIQSLALALALFSVPVLAEKNGTTKLRVLAYNVACGKWTTPEKFAEFLQPLNPDIVLLSEVPRLNRGKKGKDWSERMADALGLEHVHVGSVSSANHRAPKWPDLTGNYGGKYKSILSRTPLSNGRDVKVEGSGWRSASAVRAETEVVGRKLVLYSLHLPGFAHHKKQPTSSAAWEGSKHKALSDHIKKEDSSYDVIVGGDFNEWTDGVVMKGLLKACNLENVVTEPSIDHILYSGSRSIKLLGTKRDWGPKNLNPTNLKAEGCLSDHPWIWCELEISGSPTK